MGLYKFDEQANTLVSYSDTPGELFLEMPSGIYRDTFGDLWLHSNVHLSVRRLIGGKWILIDQYPGTTSKVSVTSLSCDSLHRLWFVSSVGLFSYYEGEWRSPVNPPVETCQQYDKFVRRYSYAESDLKKANSLLERMGTNIAAKENHKSWQASVAAELTVVAEGYEGDLWVGAQRGIFRMVPERGTWELRSLPGDLVAVNVIYRSHSRKLWFADEDGHVSSYDDRTKRWVSYDLVTLFPDTQPREITAAYEERNGRMWFGTDRGVVTFQAGEGWRLYTHRNSGLPGSEISAIGDDRAGRILVGTEEGIVILAR